MEVLEKLKKANPELPIYSVLDSAFSAYGRVLALGDCAALAAALEGTTIPAEGNCYQASVPALEATPEAAMICRAVFGEAEIEAGFCNGRGFTLNALEYHKSSEVNFTTRGLVLLLALPEMNMSRLWAEAAAREKMSRETLTEWAGYLNMLLRDMLLLYEDGASPLLYNGDLREKLVRLLTRFSKGSLFAMLRETRGFLHRLQANVNLRLQIEGYFIRLMDCR